MDAPAISLARKMAAATMALALALSLAPAAWADDAPAGTLAGSVAADGERGDAHEAAQAPEAAAQSADAMAADGDADGAGSAGGTTISIAVYRSSFPISAWSLNDADAGLTKAVWSGDDGRSTPSWWPTQASPGTAVELPGEYAAEYEPTRAGYLFSGWSTDPDAAKGATLEHLVMPEGAPEGKAYTIYALWTPKEYSVVFDLAKNPTATGGEMSMPAINDASKPMEALGNGSFHAAGLTVEAYDEQTGLIPIGTPTRTDMRFLHWVESEVTECHDGKWYVNPVKLCRFSYEPVVTARWGFKMAITVPLSITFGDFDYNEGPDGDSLEGPSRTESLDQPYTDNADGSTGSSPSTQAYFENTSSTATLNIVGLESTRDEGASDVLTTSAQSPTQEEVLGGERLLSFFKKGESAEADGVHFRLQDSKGHDAFGERFLIPASGKLEVSYRLNLDTQWADGTRNHGLVLPSSAEAAKTRIATVSYGFAIGGSDVDDKAGVGFDEELYITHNGTFYGLSDIKAAANDLSAHASSLTASPYYSLYSSLIGAEFQLYVDGRHYPVQLLGICQDRRSDTGAMAGLTFGFKEIWAYRFTNAGGKAISYQYNGSTISDTRMNLTETSTGGWEQAALRTYLRGTFYQSLAPAMRSPTTGIVGVRKNQQITPSGVQTTGETVFLPSFYEVFGAATPSYTQETSANSFQYQAFQGNGSSLPNVKAIKHWEGKPISWWLRSVYNYNGTNGAFFTVYPAGNNSANGTENSHGVVPCFAI